MKSIVLFISSVFLSMFFTGCLSPKPEPHVQTFYNEDANVKVGIKQGDWGWCSHNPNDGFNTKYDYEFKGLNITIINKTNKSIEIDWNKSAYLLYGQTQSGFMYSGIKYNDRENINRRPDYVMPKYNFQRTVFPNMLAEWVPGTQTISGVWVNKCLPHITSGSGILLIYIIDGKEYQLPVMLK